MSVERLEYFERFQTLIEDEIGASIDEALSTQPDNPMVAIAAALLKRCKVESAADAALLRSAFPQKAQAPPDEEEGGGAHRSLVHQGR